MAYTTAYLPSNKASDPVRHFFYSDTAAELAGIVEKIESDMAYAVDTKLFYRYNGTAWDGAQMLSGKGVANGYASLGATGLVPIAQLASGTPNGTKFIRDDGTLQAPGGGAAWGGITGTLSAQTDLQSALGAKAAATHAAQHKSGGSDAIKLDELAAPTDVTTLNATTALHGLLRKLDGLTTTFLRGDGTWAAVTAVASISQTEIDFGTTPVAEASFLITDAAVTPSSRLLGVVAYVAPTGKDLDELDMDGIDLKFAPGSGQFTLYARGLDGYVADKFIIYYQVGA
jgi:hypothetical protein